MIIRFLTTEMLLFLVVSGSSGQQLPQPRLEPPKGVVTFVRLEVKGTLSLADKINSDGQVLTVYDRQSGAVIEMGNDPDLSKSFELYLGEDQSLTESARKLRDKWVIVEGDLVLVHPPLRLSFFGGIGFIIILVCYRFCLSREVDNLRLSFAEAARLNRLRDFYVLLAMRQVFTVPLDRFIRRSFLLRWTPKLLCWLPSVVHVFVTIYDARTWAIGHQLDNVRYTMTLFAEFLIVLILSVLSWNISIRLIRLDRLWDEQWTALQSTNLTPTTNVRGNDLVHGA